VKGDNQYMSNTNTSTVIKSSKTKKSSPIHNVATKPVVESPSVTPETRHRMISEAAYYLAEHRGFYGGNPDSDWILAEQEIDKILGTQ
jgi:hypothetical protein